MSNIDTPQSTPENTATKPATPSPDVKQPTTPDRKRLIDRLAFWKRGSEKPHKGLQSLAEKDADSSSDAVDMQDVSPAQKPEPEADTRTPEQIKEEKLQKLSDRMGEVMDKLKRLPPSETFTRNAEMSQLMNEIEAEKELFGSNLVILEQEGQHRDMRTLIFTKPTETTLVEPVIMESYNSYGHKESREAGSETTVISENLVINVSGMGEFTTVVSQKIDLDPNAAYFMPNASYQEREKAGVTSIDVLRERYDRECKNAEIDGEGLRKNFYDIANSGSFPAPVEQNASSGERDRYRVGQALKLEGMPKQDGKVRTEGNRGRTDVAYPPRKSMFGTGEGMISRLDTPAMAQESLRLNAVS
jgi:hypothetical protein